MTRGLSQLQDQAWFPFTPNAAVAAFAVMESTDATTTDGRIVVQTRQYTAGDPRKTIWINGPLDVASGGTGIATMALGYPAVALGSASAGAHVGPSDGSWELSTGYPGFVVIGSGPIDGTVVVIRRPERTVCTAILAADAGPGASVNVDNVVAISGLSPVANSSATLSAVMQPADRALDNAICEIEWEEATNTWKIVWVHQQARSIRGTLSSAVAGGDSTETISSPVSCDGGQVPTGTVTGYNVFSWAGDSGGECWALWNEATDHYEFVNVECPA